MTLNVMASLEEAGGSKILTKIFPYFLTKMNDLHLIFAENANSKKSTHPTF
jgi:hypothetical protein